MRGNCQICGRPLTPANDCGGDCYSCVEDAEEDMPPMREDNPGFAPPHPGPRQEQGGFGFFRRVDPKDVP